MSVMTEEQRKIVEENHNLIYEYLHYKQLPIEEYYDLAAISLCKAAMKYDCTKGMFSTYAFKCMNTTITNYRRTFFYDKTIPDTHIMSLSARIADNDSEFRLENTIPSNNNIEEEVISNAALCELLNKLTEREKHVLYMIDAGYSYSEIGNLLGVSRARVGQNVKSIRAKWIIELGL